jgi:UDP-N-acetylglucosamine diphosphorylase / glucose-1-phosphate thymidylyltransferase / UDP-N-acetylgalactosamine diphosphorylase / glucosamine-1-phosphate N-acetyltransferase / galactosamine-1-phosphate N-acetyltransferase
MLIQNFVANAPAALATLAPWRATQAAPEIIAAMLAALSGEFTVRDNIAIHASSTVEAGAVLKGPILIGPRSFVAAGAYLRGGVWLEGDNIIGPCCEAKTIFMFSHTKIAHLSFVGDSVLGHEVNVEAGAMIANYRNEKKDKAIAFNFKGQRIITGVDKFGAMLADGVRIGANAVVAPGAILDKGEKVGRLQLIDQS